MSPDNLGDDVEEDEVIDFEDDNVIDSGVTEIVDEKLINNGGAEIEELAAEIEELIQEKGCRFQETRYQENNNNVGKIKSFVEQSVKHLEKENKTQGGKSRIITSAMGSAATNKYTKRSAAMPSMKSVEENNGIKGLTQATKEKESHKLGFKKIETDWEHLDCDSEKKTKEGTQQTPVQSNIKNSTDNNMGSVTKVCSALGSKKGSPMTTMNVAIKRVDVAPPHDKLLHSDYNKFEFSKRKFGERVEEINRAKRRIIVMDYHDLPKPAKNRRMF